MMTIRVIWKEGTPMAGPMIGPMAGRKLENGFRVGQIVRAEGFRPPGDGFAIIDGEVRSNASGGYYHNSPSVVLVRGVATTLSSRRVRSRDVLEGRGVYFHVNDVKVTAQGRGHPVLEHSLGQAELAGIADVLDGVVGVLSNVGQLRSAMESGRKVRAQVDRIRKLADGN